MIVTINLWNIFFKKQVFCMHAQNIALTNNGSANGQYFLLTPFCGFFAVTYICSNTDC